MRRQSGRMQCDVSKAQDAVGAGASTLVVYAGHRRGAMVARVCVAVKTVSTV
jgi:hypothetical protein